MRKLHTLAIAAMAMATAAAEVPANINQAQDKVYTFQQPYTMQGVTKYSGADHYRRRKKGYTPGYYSRHKAVMKCKKYCKAKK